MNMENNANSRTSTNELALETAQAIRDVLREFPQILLASARPNLHLPGRCKTSGIDH